MTDNPRRSFLCLHGFTGSPQSWDAVLTCTPKNDIDVLCPYILGHDPEDIIDSPSFEAEVDRLASLLCRQDRREQNQRKVHVVGYSQGGRLAIGLLVRHPGLFSAATLIGASPGLKSAAERRQRREADERLAKRLEDDGLERFVDYWQALPLFANQQATRTAHRSERLKAQREDRLRHSPKALARALRILGLGNMPSYWNDLPDLDLPVRLMVGQHDKKFRHIATQMGEVLPRATVEVAPSAGHNLLLDAPRQIADQIDQIEGS